MKKALKFVVQSILIGSSVLGIILVISYPLFLAYEYFSHRFELYYLFGGVVLALTIGILTTYFYLTPLNFVADVFLKIYASFYHEFFRQGAKYFAKENKNRPFERVVEIKISNEIKMLGFLTNRLECGDMVVFIPTSRRLTSGINMIVNSSSIREVDIRSEDFLKFVATSGAYKVSLPN